MVVRCFGGGVIVEGCRVVRGWKRFIHYGSLELAPIKDDSTRVPNGSLTFRKAEYITL
jgi:hypothetical protein